MIRALTSWTVGWFKAEDDYEEEILKEYYAFGSKKKNVQNLVGKVTQVSAKAVELDGMYLARLETNDIFSVGDKVSYSVHKTECGVDVGSVKHVTDNAGTVRTITGRITEIDKGIVTVHFGLLKYYLSAFQTSVSHCVGDRMKLKCEFTDEDDYDNAVVLEVVHEDTKVVPGLVTVINEDEQYGIVDGKVFFFLKDANFVPKIGDPVTCSCVSSRQKAFEWRASSVHRRSSNPTTSSTLNISAPEIFYLTKGETKTAEFHVTNNSSKTYRLFRVSIEPEVSHVTFLDPDNVKVILPGANVTFSFLCTSDHFGKTHLTITWVFNRSYIMRRSLKFETVSEKRTNKTNAGTVTLPGKRQVRGPKFLKYDMKPYNVPESLKEICGKITDTFLDKMIALQNSVPCLASALSEENYSTIMHTLLFLEEIAVEQSIDTLQTLSSFGLLKDYHTFSFPADSAYSKICAGDLLFASKPWEENVRYEARVWETTKTSMMVKFHPNFTNSFRQGAQYKVTFKVNRMPMRRRHQAIDIVLGKIGCNWFFPTESLRSRTPISSLVVEPMWFNKVLNPEQKNSIKHILLKNNIPLPYIIYGPPGTGKTLTLVELILQIYTVEQNSRILVTAPTNSAVDTLALQLFQFNVVHRSDCIRLTSYNTFVQGGIAEDLVSISMVCSSYETSAECCKENIPQCGKDDLPGYKVILGTMSAIGVLNNFNLPDGFFTHIIVDEAGQTSEPETLIPVALIRKQQTQLVLAGDPKQLGPVVQSKLASEYFFHRSLLQRFIESSPPYRKNIESYPNTLGYNPDLITKLVRNYRALPSIVNLYSQLFYDNELIPTVEKSDLSHRIRLFGRKFETTANVFIHTEGSEEQQDESKSWFNNAEIVQVIRVLSELTNQAAISPDDIGVITPYHLQARRIVSAMEQLNCFVPKVGSVEEFQGQERNVIILSLVRSCTAGHRGLPPFIADEQRVNVALSRAKFLNVIIGNRPGLTLHPLWSRIVSHCECI